MEFSFKSIFWNFSNFIKNVDEKQLIIINYNIFLKFKKYLIKNLYKYLNKIKKKYTQKTIYGEKLKKI